LALIIIVTPIQDIPNSSSSSEGNSSLVFDLTQFDTASSAAIRLTNPSDTTVLTEAPIDTLMPILTKIILVYNSVSRGSGSSIKPSCTTYKFLLFSSITISLLPSTQGLYSVKEKETKDRSNNKGKGTR
jgi:hypothetical protein